MDLAEKLLKIPERENAGARSSNRFSFQQVWAFDYMLKIIDADSDFFLFMEFHDDIIVLSKTEQEEYIEFFQIKTDDKDSRYVLNKAGKVVLVLQGRMGSTKLKVTIKDTHLAGARNLAAAEGRVQCQLTKYQMCLGCKACESVCRHDAISVKDDGTGKIAYTINDEKCKRCTECVNHFNAGCYMRKVLCIKRT